MSRSSPVPGSQERGQRTRGIETAWLVIAAVLIGAVAVMVLGALMVPHRQDDMWVNIVGRSAQLIALALAGGVVGAVIHDRDAAREAVRRRDAVLEAFLVEVEAAFAQVKTSRRLLRTYGFDAHQEPPRTTEQVTGFRTQMALLNDAELQFETLARKVRALSAPFGPAAGQIAEELTAVHAYLNEVLREWEADPGAVTPDGSGPGAWPHFRAFVAYDDEAALSFRGGVADRVLAIEVAVREITTPARQGGRG